MPCKWQAVKCLCCFLLQVLPSTDPIDTLNSQYWTFRAECIPDEEINMEPDSGDSLVHVYHFVTDTEANANATHVTSQVSQWKM